MAKASRARTDIDKLLRSGGQRRSALRTALSRVFCRRNIIIISEHKTQHVPVHPLLQLSVFALALGFVTWASYSTGSYMAAQNVLKEKERKIASTREENERIGTEFALLKRDLTKMLDTQAAGSGEGYAKILAEQYAAGESAVAQTPAQEAQNAIIARIEYLENKVNDLQATHDDMISDIKLATGGKIVELERIIAGVGVKSEPLKRAAALKIKQEEQAREKYGRSLAGKGDARGGPFVPVSTGVLQERETDLYFSLKQMMVLNEVVSAMPLARPIATARITSGFGRRLDPFNGRLANHTGQDFVGPRGASILATADGVVSDAGRQSGYGNTVDVDHGYGFSSKYAHLSRILVRPGQRVKKGQVIGVQGSTGRSTGAHLHYEVRYHDMPLNPRNFLDAGRRG